MKTCLVSLISDQTAPSVLVAMHFRPEFLLFISASQTGAKRNVDLILKTLKLHDPSYSPSSETIVVMEDSPESLRTRVGNWQAKTLDSYHFIVNLNCADNLMSIAAYDHFKELGGEMIYAPMSGAKYLVAFPKTGPHQPIAIRHKLTVEEYLSAHGFQVVNSDRLSEYKSQAESRRDLTDFIFENYLGVRPLLASLGESLRRINRSEVRTSYAL